MNSLINKRFIIKKSLFKQEHNNKTLTNVYITSHQLFDKNIIIGGYLLYGASFIEDGIKLAFVTKSDFEGNIDNKFGIKYNEDCLVKKIKCCEKLKKIFISFNKKDSQEIIIYDFKGNIINNLEEELFIEKANEKDIVDFLICKKYLVILIKYVENDNNFIGLMKYDLDDNSIDEYILNYKDYGTSVTRLFYDNNFICFCTSVCIRLKYISRVYEFKINESTNYKDEISIKKVNEFKIENCKVNFIYKDSKENYIVQDEINSKLKFYEKKFNNLVENDYIFIETFGQDVNKIIEKNKKIGVFCNYNFYIFDDYDIIINRKYPNINIDSCNLPGFSKVSSFSNDNDILISSKSIGLFDNIYTFFILNDLFTIELTCNNINKIDINNKDVSNNENQINDCKDDNEYSNNNSESIFDTNNSNENHEKKNRNKKDSITSSEAEQDDDLFTDSKNDNDRNNDDDNKSNS